MSKINRLKCRAFIFVSTYMATPNISYIERKKKRFSHLKEEKRELVYEINPKLAEEKNET